MISHKKRIVEYKPSKHSGRTYFSDDDLRGAHQGVVGHLRAPIASQGQILPLCRNIRRILFCFGRSLTSWIFFRFYHSVMNAQWRLLECFKVMKSQPSTSLFMSLAIFAVIATVANVAKIAYEDRSLVANFFLFVTIIQVLDLHKS